MSIDLKMICMSIDLKMICMSIDCTTDANKHSGICKELKKGNWENTGTYEIAKNAASVSPAGNVPLTNPERTSNKIISSIVNKIPYNKRLFRLACLALGIDRKEFVFLFSKNFSEKIDETEERNRGNNPLNFRFSRKRQKKLVRNSSFCQNMRSQIVVRESFYKLY